MIRKLFFLGDEGVFEVLELDMIKRRPVCVDAQGFPIENNVGIPIDMIKRRPVRNRPAPVPEGDS